MNTRQAGFTLVEIAIVLLIVAIMLGYTVAMFPRQQQLKKYGELEREMDRIVDAIVGFAQVNGRLPCPATPVSTGDEDGGGGVPCNFYGGFVPVNTLGLAGRLNADTLLMDPWGNPYRYYVSSSDSALPGVGNLGTVDFVESLEMRAVGLVDTNGDGRLDLDGQFVICNQADATLDDICDPPAIEVMGNAAGTGGPYAGAPFVVVSLGANGGNAAAGDELVNRGSVLTDFDLTMGIGPSGNEYLLKNVGAGETTFVKRTTGFADDFDDMVMWVSPNILYSKMIESGQLP